MNALKLIFILFCFINPKYLFAQNSEFRGFEELGFITTISEAEELAKFDMRNGNVHLLLVSGINPSFSKTDIQLTSNYNFKYEDFGCVAPKNEYIIAYNRIMLKNLCEKYGKGIFKKIRKDIIGFKIFKKENFC